MATCQRCAKGSRETASEGKTAIHTRFCSLSTIAARSTSLDITTVYH